MDVDAERKRFKAVLRKAAGRLPADTELIVLDWAGIGDACHTRLIAQHLARERRLAWLTTPMIAGLFQDDSMPVIACYASTARDVRQPEVRALAAELDAIARAVLPVPVLHMSYRVCQVYDDWLKRISNYADLFFRAAGIQRDRSIRHTLVHNGQGPEGRYAVIEPYGYTTGAIFPGIAASTARVLADAGVSLYQVGAANDALIEGCVDARGLPLYDTYSLVKGALGFIGRASGNETLTFYSQTPLIEVDVPGWASAHNCGYHGNMVNIVSEALPLYAPKFFGVRNG